MNVPPRVNGRRAVAPRNDRDLARLFFFPFLRSGAGYDTSISSRGS
jgi:hypothetical protein